MSSQQETTVHTSDESDVRSPGFSQGTPRRLADVVSEHRKRQDDATDANFMASQSSNTTRVLKKSDTMGSLGGTTLMLVRHM